MSLPGCGAPMPPWACGELMPSGVRALCDRCLPPTVETTMGEIADRLTELAREEVERCSCDESLALRDRLSLASAGSLAIHIVKGDGYWSVELWRNGELARAQVGLPTVGEALVFIGEWMK